MKKFLVSLLILFVFAITVPLSGGSANVVRDTKGTKINRESLLFKPHITRSGFVCYSRLQLISDRHFTSVINMLLMSASERARVH